MFIEVILSCWVRVETFWKFATLYLHTMFTFTRDKGRGRSASSSSRSRSRSSSSSSRSSSGSSRSSRSRSSSSSSSGSADSDHLYRNIGGATKPAAGATKAAGMAAKAVGGAKNIAATKSAAQRQLNGMYSATGTVFLRLRSEFYFLPKQSQRSRSVL